MAPSMLKIGMVGGVAWPSTVDYYRLLCMWSQRHHGRQGVAYPLPTPPIAIESLVQHDTRKLRGVEGALASWDAFNAAWRVGLMTLQRAGCAFGIIANNTAHMRFDAICAGVEMPVLSILDATAVATRTSGAQQALVLGTSVTMRSDAYQRALAAHGIAALPRLPEDRVDAMQHLIDTEFAETGTPAGRRALLDICRTHVPDPSTTAVLLACTELPLAFAEQGDRAVFQVEGFTFVNTSAVHVRAALERSLGAPPDID